MKQTALITGASGGIGLELARVFARERYNLVLVARNEARLSALGRELADAYGVTALACAADLSERDAAAAVYAFTRDRGVAVDVLVNNAGFGDFGPFLDAEWEKQYEMVQVNITALMQLTRLYLPEMTARGSGRILNIASTAAFQPGPLMSVYYASKAFVLSFSEALSVELKGTGVAVTTVCPGPTTTGFSERANLGASGLFAHLKNATAAEVAEFAYRALSRGRVVAVHGLGNRLLVFGSKHSPRRWVREVAWRIQKER